LTQANLTNSRILIVDDQKANADVIAMFLRSDGYSNIRCLTDSRQVIAVIGEFDPDLLMLDLNMPHVGGLAVMKQLSGVIPETDYLPVLVLSGDDTPETKANAVSHGASDFLSKPLNRTEVRLRVRNLLQTRHLHVQLQALSAALEEQSRERTELAEKLAQISASVAH
jgi:putative two-component system response regulator